MSNTNSNGGIRITGLKVQDIRFPTSEAQHGSDAMNASPDYSCAYVTLETNQPGLRGTGLAFTIGRGNEICCAALHAIAHHVTNRTLASITDDFAAFSRSMTGDDQIRWLGPEKGVVHLAAAAIINAVWDLYAKERGMPLWRLLADMSPDEIVKCIDFSYITDALTPEEAVHILQTMEPGKKEREQVLLEKGFPAYTTSVGWLGYTDEQVVQLCADAISAGWNHMKMKVGRSLEDDMRRAALIRESIGPDRALMMDANQIWGIDEAIEQMSHLATFKPLWIEEPTSPDDILGYARIAEAVRPIKVAAGEHCHNRIIFKQLMQLGAIDICQIDACRVAGVNENLAIMLLAKKFDIPVCPHAGGVGLCEQVQHLSMFDFIAVGGSMENRMIEYVEHLHEHFIDPVRIEQGRYLAPSMPGFSIEMKAESLHAYEFPGGPVWHRRVS